MKIKLIKVYAHQHCYECGGIPSYLQSESDWENITDEEFFLLQQFVKIPLKDGTFYAILTPEPKPLKVIISDIVTKIEADKKRQLENKKRQEEERIGKLAKNKEKKLLKLQKKIEELKSI